MKILLACLAGLLTCIAVAACGPNDFCGAFSGFYLEGLILGADGCPLTNATVHFEWSTARDADRDLVPSPRHASTDENGRFDVYLSTYIHVSGLFCPSDWYEPTDLEVIELTIDATDSVETLEVTIAEEMIVGSNSVSEIDIDLGVIILQEINTCGEDATGDESEHTGMSRLLLPAIPR